MDRRTLLSFLPASLLTRATLAAEPEGSSAPAGLAARCFELRTYTALPGKLEALHGRFRNHTLRLFGKHGMDVVGFWVPTDAEAGAGEKLIYVLAHKSRVAADPSWKAFREDPEWLAARTASEVDGRLTAKVESVFLAPTDYSPVK